MANTYTQIFIHFVFAVQHRKCIIQPEWKQELYKYIGGIIRNQNHKLLVINGMPDHIHILLGLNPIQSISSLMQDIKGDSSKWINQKKFLSDKFAWQEGYGAFSVSKSQVTRVINYINNQQEHHKKKTFLEEYKEFLKLYEIEFDERYIFKPIE